MLFLFLGFGLWGAFVVVDGHSWLLMVIRGHWWSLVVIGGH